MTAALTDFLLARIAEDEARARRTVVTTGFSEGHVGDERLLAECAAKRQVIELHRLFSTAYDDPKGEYQRAEWVDVLRALASVYADHPDFQEAWR